MNAETPTLHISDHAVVRYLERHKGVNIDDIKARAAKQPYDCSTDSRLLSYMRNHCGIDTDAIRREIRSPLVLAAFAAGAVSIGLPGGLKLIIKDASVVTVSYDKFRNPMRFALRKNQHRGIRDRWQCRGNPKKRGLSYGHFERVQDE